jgi:hypothetical protein
MKHADKWGALALILAVGAANAAPSQIGTGPGTYFFDGAQDDSFFVALNPGTYTLSGVVGSVGFNLNHVWLAESAAPDPFGPSSLQVFTKNTPREFSDTPFALTLTKAADLYVNIDTRLGSPAYGAFAGALRVSAVPEPASLGLMLAGIGMLGFLCVRRKRD